MRNFVFKQFTRRHRPHIQSPGAILFVTYRLAGSIPKSVVRSYEVRKKLLEKELRLAERAANAPQQSKQWREQLERFQRQSFAKFEAILHQSTCGPTWMKDERVAEVVAEGLRELDGEDYRLDCYCVMSNHVHIVFKPFVAESNLLEVLNVGQPPAFFSPYPRPARDHEDFKGTKCAESKCHPWAHRNFLGA